MTLYSDKNEIVFRGKVAVHLKPRKGKAAAPATQPSAAVPAETQAGPAQ